MLLARDNLALSVRTLRAYRLRGALTILGLTLGVATIITVMTLIQGANAYVEQKIANLGTNVFQVSRIPIVVTDFRVILRALRHRYLTLEDARAVAERCPACQHVGARSSVTLRSRYGNNELTDTTVIGHTAPMGQIDTRTIEQGRYFTDLEDQHDSMVCLAGAKLVEELFPGLDPIGRLLRLSNHECAIIGVYQRIGTILGQDQDNFAVVPMGAFEKLRGGRFSVILDIKASGSGRQFEQAQDEVRLALRARRQLGPGQPDDFYIGTASSYIELWKSISGAFFAVFMLVSAISSLVGGIVIMNVMLVSVSERTKEIGVRRAVGATQSDILRQFLTESVMQCLIGGAIGILVGFAAGVALRRFTAFPAEVQTWVATLGLILSSSIGLFFGIYPATRAARLDPVVALRAE